jgi:hypothetical protein
VKYVRPNLKAICKTVELMFYNHSGAVAFYLNITPTGGFDVSTRPVETAVEVLVPNKNKIRKTIKAALDVLEARNNEQRRKVTKERSQPEAENSTYSS